MRLRAALLLAILISPPSIASAAELVMLRRAACPWCAAWDRSVAPIYSKTDAGRIAPLRVVDLDKESAPEGLARAARYTPTFVLMAEGQEIGRIEGYPGEDFFWGLLDRIISKVPQTSRTASAMEAPW